MVITLELDGSSRQVIARAQSRADAVPDALSRALSAACVVGGDAIAAMLQRNELDLHTQHGALGIAGSVMGWMISEDPLLGAIGVPSNSPAARYATAQEFGKTITSSRPGGFLAIPVSREAKQYSSPRDMSGLTLIPRRGRPPLLVLVIGGPGSRKKSRIEVHWVLVKSVTLTATHWLASGAAMARDTIVWTFAGVFNAKLDRRQ